MQSKYRKDCVNIATKPIIQARLSYFALSKSGCADFYKL